MARYKFVCNCKAKWTWYSANINDSTCEKCGKSGIVGIKQ